MRMSNPKIKKRMDSVGEVFVGSQRLMPANQLKENNKLGSIEVDVIFEQKLRQVLFLISPHCLCHIPAPLFTVLCTAASQYSTPFFSCRAVSLISLSQVDIPILPDLWVDTLQTIHYNVGRNGAKWGIIPRIGRVDPAMER